jgi:hypothetical protein
MTEREQIEEQILQVLASEMQAIPLSNKLFSPEGLFSQIAKTEEERRTIAQSPLFHQAQRRLTDLQRQEAAEFGRVVEQVPIPPGEGHFWFKFESSDPV